VKRLTALLVASLMLAACSGQNKYEKQADEITRAVMNNDLRPVQDQIAKGISITRVQVAQWSDELNGQGKLISVKEVTTGCAPGWHCFNVQFQKHAYTERMQLDDTGHVVNWQFHIAPASPQVN
jgi:hypothetical protein